MTDIWIKEQVNTLILARDKFFKGTMKSADYFKLTLEIYKSVDHYCNDEERERFKTMYATERRKQDEKR